MKTINSILSLICILILELVTAIALHHRHILLFYKFQSSVVMRQKNTTLQGDVVFSACCCDKNQSLFQSILRIVLFCVLQVDVLKSTAVPLMKKFGIDGEGFDLKARTH